MGDDSGGCIPNDNLGINYLHLNRLGREGKGVEAVKEKLMMMMMMMMMKTKNLRIKVKELKSIHSIVDF
jgi:hypothetical protein